ncbi:uncharacterized protein YgbK (DUF1537 family) [Labrenzia sp. EL_142]|nr:uncharacterized protein YgbK (DUF1537 family) [Labrenzia sp. EL_142]
MSSGLFLSYYGDDFTGSTDVMEALSAGGVETVLFTSIPDPSRLERFSAFKAIGLAGTSRSQTPERMSEAVPASFSWLRDLGACFCHYKVCSTFDSAPDKGSIGRALELGLTVFGQERTAIVVGAPQLRRYTFFGNLFAAYQDKIYRIDRHPVMSRHPATPMNEADLAMHLEKQTSLPMASVSPEDLPGLADRLATGEGQPSNVSLLLDVFDHASQQAVGEFLNANASRLGPFVIGSSGIEYALLHAWKRSGKILSRPSFQPLEAHSRIAVVSGSCSPTTGRQIDHALQRGFKGVQVDYASLVSGVGLQEEYERVLTLGSAILSEGSSPLLFTAKGAHGTETETMPGDQDRVGRTLGRLLAKLQQLHDLKRVVVAGGDTSSHALSELGIYALTLRYPLAATPGSPVCHGHLENGHKIEIALKGGQIGDDTYFSSLRDGSV